MNSIWDQTVTSNASPQFDTMQNQNMQDQMPMGGMFQQPWMNPMMGAPLYMNPMMQQRQFQQQQQNETQIDTSTNKEPVLIDEFPPQNQENLIKDEIKATTSNIVMTLESSDNPKHRNSKFLKFLKKLEHGAYTIENEQLVKVPEKIAEFKRLEEERQQKEQMRANQEESKGEQIDTKTDLFKKLWNSEQEVTDDQFEQMMQQWDEEGQDEQFNKLFMEEWGKQWQMEEPGQIDVIPFEPKNKYNEMEGNLKLAKGLVEDGKTQEAILALQAEVTKNPENAEAWRLMGQLYQENDQDDYAILAFKKAYEIDPYDLDSLLCLGISCTNELEQKEAIRHLHSYLKYHPEYSSLPGIQQENLDFDNLREAYNRAFQSNPKDYNLCLAMGVLCFIQRNFAEAITHFQNGIRENPTDHTLWNKYGAALANNLQIEDAIKTYMQALDLRPNYVRTLVNVGLAFRNQAKFAESVPFFLNAILLNPQAKHIWRYVRSSFLQMNRLDLVEKMNFNDPNLFRDEFNLIISENLPKPNLERLYENEIWNQ